jgi:transposase
MQDGQHQHGKRRTRARFSEEFKRDAVEMVRSSGRPIAHVAAELGIHDCTLGNWVRRQQVDDGERDGTTSDDQAYIRRLETELAESKSERDLLKRTVAFWVSLNPPINSGEGSRGAGSGR